MHKVRMSLVQRVQLLSNVCGRGQGRGRSNGPHDSTHGTRHSNDALGFTIPVVMSGKAPFPGLSSSGGRI